MNRISDVTALAHRKDKPRVVEFLEMKRRRRRAHPDHSANLTRGQPVCSATYQQTKDRQSVAMGKRLQGTGRIVVVHNSYISKILELCN